MTAVNVVCQPRHKCLHIVTDAASYYPDGIVGGLGTKVFTVPHWPGVVAVRGQGTGGPLIGHSLALNFATFDLMLAQVEQMLPALVIAHDLKGGIELILAGFSERGPEAYVIETSAETPVGITAEAADAMVSAGSGFLPEPYVLQRLPNITAGPMPPGDVVEAAWFEGFTEDDDPEKVVKGLGQLLEMQRQSLFPGARYLVGGWGSLTTVCPTGLEQRILQRWPDDKVGELIAPAPMDWRAWNTEHGFKAGPTPAPAARLRVV
jgi:hypothetical protein